jgi:hypothetical protein
VFFLFLLLIAFCFWLRNNIMFVPTQHCTNGAISWTTEAHTSCIGSYIFSVLFVSVLSTLIFCPFHIIGSLVLSHNVEGVFLKKQSLCESSKLSRHKCQHVILNRNKASYTRSVCFCCSRNGAIRAMLGRNEHDVYVTIFTDQIPYIRNYQYEIT